MGILAEWPSSQRGVSAAWCALLRELVSIAREQAFGEVVLNAQTYAIGFYMRHGFVAEGPEFLDAGIAHRKMRLGLD
jgi:predicted GNAT family N-acyltransferase